ncbi:MAG: hypothetical protein NT121_08980 [Chloroflexi bacterium]|nr:hypothetical protein [Chloroflexota bacterium]
MTDTWRLLMTPPARGAWNMAVDEAILETAGRGASLPTLRLYAWAPACLSLGFDEPRVLGSVLESYYRLAGALVQAVRQLGLPVEMEADAPSASATKGPVCFEVPSAYEIVVAGKKLVGSAQARKKEGVLQHGTFPLTGDLTRITQVLAFPDEAARAAAAQKLLLRATTAESVTGQVSESQLGLRLERGELSTGEKARADELFQKKYDHSDWTERS